MAKTIKLSIARQIEKSKAEVTILFSDIVHSTRFWDKHGDTAGRLMLDLHNKLLFPVVTTFRGTVIKTIGDAIMASFKSPRDAIRAAIAMQQRLARSRKKDPDFDIKIRIGIHTGEAIVEAKDVYGDMVNVASRVEGAARSNQILLSGSTVEKLGRKRNAYLIKRKRSFVPKGKKKALVVWTCDWEKHPSLINVIKQEGFLPANRRQQVEVVVYFVVGVLGLYALFDQFVRYLLADFEFIALYLLDPHPVLKWTLISLILVGIGFGVRYFVRLRTVPVRILRIVKGGFGFGGVILICLAVGSWIEMPTARYWSKPLYRTAHGFVEVVADQATIFRRASTKAPVLTRAERGGLYLRAGQLRRQKLKWYKIHIRHKGARYGFIQHQRPAAFGVAASQLTKTRRLSIRYYHLYGLLLSLLGFVWGHLSFRLRPL